MSNPINAISLSDLMRLRDCLKTGFGQLYKDGVMVYGETHEENERFMKMYFDVAKYYHEVMKIELVDYNKLLDILNTEIKKRPDENKGP